MCLAVPGVIESVRDEGALRFGRVRFGRVHRDVCLTYVPDAGVGDWVIVDVEAAAKTLALLEEAGL